MINLIRNISTIFYFFYFLDTIPVSQYYSNLLESVRSVLDGNTEAAAYEDNLREMFGVNAYIAFTLDKVVSYAVRQVFWIFNCIILLLIIVLWLKLIFESWNF